MPSGKPPPASRFARLLRMEARRITDTNLKTVLGSVFSAPTLQSDGLARMAPLYAADAALLGVPPGTIGMQVRITGRSFGRQPITFQQMHIPPTPYALKFDFSAPGPDAAEI